MIRLFRPAPALAALSFLATLSCNGTDDPAPSTEPDGVKPLYALLSLVSTTDSNASYVNLFDTPDITEVKFSGAREFPGASGIDAVNGKLFVSSGDAPLVMRFGITEALTWKDEGSVNFANYGSTAGLWGNGFGNSKGYMTFNSVERVVWDPSTMTIRGQNVAGNNLVRDRDGLLVRAAYDRALVPQGTELYWPYYWSDNDYFRFSQTSQIALYDTAADQLRSLIDAPCPGLDFASKDDDGNLYFSNWVFAVAQPAFDASAPQTCTVRVKAGQTTIDPEFRVRFPELTDGRQGAAFHYIGQGKAFFAVFHHEAVPAGTLPRKAIEDNYWRFWTYDMVTRTAKPLEGIDVFAGGYRAAKVNGRTFLLLPRKDYSSTVAYELFADGTVKRLFESVGWAYQFLRVR
ncbi:MxcI [Pendulispora brunnea]|uniref:MxcI n=1 Tax=Pendulispora brunnea TaxID=2905690 RepID=A0ABZ2KAA6_9BACT